MPAVEDEIELKFVRARGPGGQHVNKASTAVELRFPLKASRSLPDDVKKRLLQIARTRVSEEGILVIQASRFRSQKQNREDALERLAELIRRAQARPKKRKKTRPSRQANERRLEQKKRRSALKKDRRAP
jgi:ribosome-associated protein